MKITVDLIVTAEDGEELDVEAVMTDAKLHMMDFGQAHADGRTSRDIEGGWYVVRADVAGHE